MASESRAANVQPWASVCAQLKDFGKNLLMGNLNLINVSLPVKMFEPRSYLQKLADAWLYTNWLQVPEPSMCRPGSQCTDSKCLLRASYHAHGCGVLAHRHALSSTAACFGS